MKKRGFTLIELLVVIAIIGLLLSILLPALTRVKVIAWRVVCASDQRGFVEAYRAYSEQWDGRFPLGVEGAGNWFWDISYYNTDLMMEAGMLPKNFYCPSIKTKWPPPPWGKDDRFWRWTEWGTNPPSGSEPQSENERKGNFRVCGMISLLDLDLPNDALGYGNRRDRPDDISQRFWRRQDMIPTNPHKEWAENIHKLKNTGEYELVVDALVTDSGNGPTPSARADKRSYYWQGIRGGSYGRWQLTDDSNHLDRRSVPEGSNIGYADGHVAWRNIEFVHGWFQRGTPFFWY